VWDAVTSVIRHPERMLTTVKAKGLALDAHRVDAAAERAEVQRQLSQVRTKRARLLDLYLSEMRGKPAFETKDTPLRQDEDRLAAPLAQTDAAVAQTTASASRHAAAYSKLVAKGLDRLDDAGRQALLRLLVERFDGENDCADAHGACALLGG
jgi:hypothetical protein